ncbi:MAG: nitroreductase family deazaflavin-dependent oxidoreductase [Microthrixaceae bacterium]|nr:nitroreductase family deazaflavin-dependent oxidoreductase [Microthrixaceae bacterium]
MAKSNRVIEIGAWMLENGHRLALKVTGGRWPRRLLGMEPVELHTTGRRSGQKRSTMLTAPVIDGDRVVLVASKGGHSDHPDWYRNLTADPRVEITRDGDTTPMVARTATPEERAELWPRIVASYKGYEGYQRNTDREIPVVICEPAA